MKVKFKSSFEKDLRNIKVKQVLSKLREVIIECKTANSLIEIRNIKKIRGYKTFYRLRIGNYRLGLELVEDELIFTRLLHRKEIYRFFP